MSSSKTAPRRKKSPEVIDLIDEDSLQPPPAVRSSKTKSPVVVDLVGAETSLMRHRPSDSSSVCSKKVTFQVDDAQKPPAQCSKAPPCSLLAHSPTRKRKAAPNRSPNNDIEEAPSIHKRARIEPVQEHKNHGGPTCPACTLVNEASAHECSLCHTPLVASAASRCEDTTAVVVPTHSLQQDEALARTLQQEEEEARQTSQARESQSMLSTIQGRAWVLIQQVLDLHKRLVLPEYKIETVAVDDMVFLAEKFLACQEDFMKQQKCAHVSLVYHYTNKKNLESIKQGGLLSGVERDANGITQRKVEAFGSGIYTGNNPFAFSHFGSVGLLVAVVKGRTVRVDRSQPRDTTTQVDTLVGNKMLAPASLATHRSLQDEERYSDEIILKQSAQALPLLKFSNDRTRGSRTSSSIADAMWKFHQELQTVMDDFFHDGRRTELSRILPPTANVVALPLPNVAVPLPSRPPPSAFAQLVQAQLGPSAFAALLQSHRRPRHTRPQASVATMPPPPPFAMPRQPPTHTLQASVATMPSLPPLPPFAMPLQPVAALPPVAPLTGTSSTRAATDSKVLHYHAPTTLQDLSVLQKELEIVPQSKRSTCECALCLDPLSSGATVVLIKACQHEFHQPCIEAALNNSSKCPICRKTVGATRGSCPSGTMNIRTRRGVYCAGFETSSSGTIEISYVMAGGTQMPYHQNPGQPYSGTTRVAYLPRNVEGKKLLERLKAAWMMGLCFTIGSSLTTGRANVITWSSIHHKTSPSGGQHGFPDAQYLQNCNAELDALGVPKATGVSAEAASEANQGNKEEFLLFTRVLIKYLEQKDPPMHVRAKAVIRECAEKHKRKEKGYEKVDIMRTRLRQTVGEAYWRRAHDYLKHFKKKKRGR